MAHESPPSLTLGKRLAILTTGYGFKKIEEIILDYVVYGALAAYGTYALGPAYGAAAAFALMAPVSALLCWYYIKVYDYLKIDWFGFESLKEFRHSQEGGGFMKRIIRSCLKKGDGAAFVALCLVADPFMTTLYLRKGSFNGLTERDRRIFWLSVVCINAYWTIRWVAIAEVAFFIIGLLPSGVQESLKNAFMFLT